MNIMRIRIAAAAAVIVLPALAGIASAGPQDTAPGNPDDANCTGQTNAFFARVGGIGNVAKFNDVSVQEVQAVVATFCGPGPQGTELGTPGDADCTGQTNAYLAQAARAGGTPGVGNIAKLNEISVQEVKAVVEAFCNPPA